LLRQSVKARGGQSQTAPALTLAQTAHQHTRHRTDTGWTALDRTCKGGCHDKATLPASCCPVTLRSLVQNAQTHIYTYTHARFAAVAMPRTPVPADCAVCVGHRSASHRCEARHHHHESNHRFRFDMAYPPAPAVARNEPPTGLLDARMRCVRPQRWLGRNPQLDKVSDCL
jgi:hypothetical protein